MKTVILVIAFGLLVALLIGGNTPQNMMNSGVGPCYAMGPHPQPDPEMLRHRTPRSVSEPFTLSLLGTGVAGVGIYLFLRKRNKKK